MSAQVLIYNFKEGERFQKIRRYLRASGAEVRTVQTPEFLQPLGWLFQLPGFSPNTSFNLGGNFKDEMMVMYGFSNEEMDAFLGFFRKNDLAPVDLKAVLTPVTCHWNSLQLHEELVKEHQAMKK